MATSEKSNKGLWIGLGVLGSALAVTIVVARARREDLENCDRAYTKLEDKYYKVS